MPRNLFVLLLVTQLVACGDDSPTAPTSTTTSVEVRFSAEAIRVGDAVQFEAYETLSNGTTRRATAATWGSDNPAVATVSSSGLVTAVSPGEATIFADVNPRGTVRIRVLPAETLTFSLIVVTTGSGEGTVTSTPPGITCGSGSTDCREEYVENQVVSLIPTPDAGSLFAGWADGSHPDCQDGELTMSAIRRCTATFNRQVQETRYVLEVAVAGDGEGTVTSRPSGISCGNDCTEEYPAGTVVTLSATPSDGSTFDGWSGDRDCSNGIVTMSVDRSCTATLSLEVETFRLSISKTGSGQGTVTSSPGGIDCGGDCAEEYETGTVVTLTAVPSSGSTFDGWSGDSDCSNGVVAMNADRDCEATFVAAPPPLTSTTLTFGGLSGGFTSYTKSGFTVQPTTGVWTVRTTYGNPAPFIQFRRDQSTVGEVRVTAGGSMFTFESVDLYSSTSVIPYVIKGIRNSSTVYTLSGTEPQTFGNFTEVSNPHDDVLIDRILIELTNTSGTTTNPMGLDNIVVAK
jgi:hypothetical protein